MAKRKVKLIVKQKTNKKSRKKRELKINTQYKGGRSWKIQKNCQKTGQKQEKIAKIKK